MRIEKVPLLDIRPSDGNPRSDFGDIDTLCRQINATGGVPVNPIITVRDGELYRIVDGERRFRALSLIHTSDFEVPVIVADGWDEALSAVAALATGTSAKPLTDDERQMGFQQSLLLGVDEDTQADAMGCDVDTVRQARTKSAPVGWQGTIEQLAAANQFEGADREAVLSAGQGWRVAARNAELRGERMAGIAKAKGVMSDLGVDCVDDVPEGYDWALGVVDPDFVEMAGGWPEGTVYVDDGDRLSVYVPHHDNGETLRRAAARMSEACVSMQNEAIRHIVGEWCGNSVLPSVALMREATKERRKLSFQGRELSQAASMAARSTPSLWEMFTYLVGRIERSAFVVDGEHLMVGDSKSDILAIVDLAIATGWEPSAAQSEIIDALRR